MFCWLRLLVLDARVNVRFRVSRSIQRYSYLRLRVKGLLRVQVLRFRAQGLEFWGEGFRA